MKWEKVKKKENQEERNEDKCGSKGYEEEKNERRIGYLVKEATKEGHLRRRRKRRRRNTKKEQKSANLLVFTRLFEINYAI